MKHRFIMSIDAFFNHIILFFFETIIKCSVSKKSHKFFHINSPNNCHESVGFVILHSFRNLLYIIFCHNCLQSKPQRILCFHSTTQFFYTNEINTLYNDIQNINRLKYYTPIYLNLFVLLYIIKLLAFTHSYIHKKYIYTKFR